MEKTEKICSFCNKSTKNLGEHIVKWHPKILEKLEEFNENDDFSTESSPVSTPQKGGFGVVETPKRTYNSAKAMVMEHLDTVLAIHLAKVIGNLDASPESLKTISNAVNPPQQTQLSEFMAFHNFMNENKPQETGSTWADIAKEGLPMLTEMIKKIPAKQQKPEIKRPDFVKTKPEDLVGGGEIVRHKSNQGGDLSDSRGISGEVGGDKQQPSNITEEPKNNG